MVPDRCATCPRKCWQLLAYLESLALDEQGPLADPRFLAPSPREPAMPSAAWQAPCEPRLEAA
jgi:hypothetical protein